MPNLLHSPNAHTYALDVDCNSVDAWKQNLARREKERGREMQEIKQKNFFHAVSLFGETCQTLFHNWPAPWSVPARGKFFMASKQLPWWRTPLSRPRCSQFPQLMNPITSLVSTGAHLISQALGIFLQMAFSIPVLLFQLRPCKNIIYPRPSTMKAFASITSLQFFTRRGTCFNTT